MRDVVIIGGGHNGLVAAAFVAKAGLKTLVLERAGQIGGCAITSEIAPGFRCPTLAHRAAIDPAMVMRYFGNKDLLFAAAADFDLQIPDLSDGDRDKLGARLVAHFLDRWERDEALVVLLRSSTTNDEAAQRMRKIFSSQLRPVTVS